MLIKPKPRVIVVGGGFGGLEAAFYLRKRLAQRVDITLISQYDYFLFKPNMIYVPFGLDPDALKISLDHPTQRKNIAFVNARVNEVDPVKKTVTTESGESYAYDYLVLATGVVGHTTEIEGLSEYAHLIWTVDEMQRLGKKLENLQPNSSKIPQLLFVLPPGNQYAAPLYEMVFMIDTWLRRKGVRQSVNMVWTTHEHSYLESFGMRLHEVLLREFAERDIRHYNALNVRKVDSGRVQYQNGDSYPFDILVSFPPYVASTKFAGLPKDEHGFIATELYTRRVVGFDDIFVAGDTGDFPLKQGFAAFSQADAIAENIAAEVTGETAHFAFKPFGMAVIDHLDKATFTQVPLHTIGGTHVISDSPYYKAGTSVMWRLGKQMMGKYLPWRFSEGEPLRTGLGWEGMGAGLKVMSEMLTE